MRNSLPRTSRICIMLIALVFVASSCGGSDGSIDVTEARYRLSRSDLGAGYFTVSNTTDDEVRLLSASAEGVGSIELHESMAADDGTMSMQARPEGFVVPAGETITLAPGGKHLMLFDPGPGGEELTINLDFGDETISVVAAFDEAASAAASSMDDMDHGEDEMDGMDDMDDGQGDT